MPLNSHTFEGLLNMGYTPFLKSKRDSKGVLQFVNMDLSQKGIDSELVEHNLEYYLFTRNKKRALLSLKPEYYDLLYKSDNSF